MAVVLGPSDPAFDRRSRHDGRAGRRLGNRVTAGGRTSGELAGGDEARPMGRLPAWSLASQGADLFEQGGHVEQPPVFDDLAALNPEEGHGPVAHFLAGRLDALELPSVRSRLAHASGHEIPLGHDVFDLDTATTERGAPRADQILDFVTID